MVCDLHIWYCECLLWWHGATSFIDEFIWSNRHIEIVNVLPDQPCHTSQKITPGVDIFQCILACAVRNDFLHNCTQMFLQKCLKLINKTDTPIRLYSKFMQCQSFTYRYQQKHCNLSILRIKTSYNCTAKKIRTRVMPAEASTGFRPPPRKCPPGRLWDVEIPSERNFPLARSTECCLCSIEFRCSIQIPVTMAMGSTYMQLRHMGIVPQ